MAYIGRSTDKLSNIEVLDAITFDGSSSYTLQKNSVNFTPSSANNVLVSIDGVVQANNFTVSGSTIDFGVAVPSTSTCDWIYHIGVGLITTPADGTVTTAKLADASITSAKLASGVGGSLVKLAETNVTSAVASVSFDGYFSSSYTNYIVYLFDVVPASSTLLNFRFSRSGTDVTTSHYSYAKHEANRSSGATGDTAAGGRWLANRVSNFADTIDTTVAYGGTAGHIEILNPLNTSHYKRFIARSTQFKSGLAEVHSSQLGGFLVDSTSAISGISFFMDSGNINSGLFQLYGVAN